MQYGGYGATVPGQMQGPAYGHPSQGGYYEQSMPQVVSTKSPFARGTRRSSNFLAIGASIFLPWGLFIGVLAVQSFELHNDDPGVMTLLDILLAVIVAAFGVLAVLAWRRHEDQDPTWYTFLFGTSLSAWIVGLIIGGVIYRRFMLPYYDVISLNVYPQVNPSTMKGQQLMDAGRIDFVKDAYVDTSKSMGFRNDNMYCVAPIVTNATSNGGTYDFWAVGINCCNSHASDFHCGEYNNPEAHSGLRLMKDTQRAFFRLAVQQAEAAFNLQTYQPLFLYWMKEPQNEIESYRDEGYKWFLIALFSWLGFQLVAVVATLIVVTKLG